MVSNEKLLKMMVDGNFDAVVESLKANIREENIGRTRTGDKTRLKIIEKFNKRVIRDRREGLAGAIHMANDYIGFCDGFRAVWSRNDFGFESARSQIQLDNIIDERHLNVKNPGIEIAVADFLADLKIFKKEQIRTKDPFILHTSERDIGVNPDFLLDLIKFTEAESITIYGINEPIFAHNYEKDLHGLTLPVRYY